MLDVTLFCDFNDKAISLHHDAVITSSFQLNLEALKVVNDSWYN